MAFFLRKETAWDRRLKAVDKELAKVQARLKAAARGGAAPRSAVVPRTARPPSQGPAARPMPPASAEPEGAAGPSSPTSSPPETLFPHLPKNRTAVSGKTEPDLFTPAASAESGEEPANRHRFASYFMAGHFQDLRPIRHERRIQRNKAIVSVIVTLLVLAWLSYWFLW